MDKQEEDKYNNQPLLLSEILSAQCKAAMRASRLFTWALAAAAALSIERRSHAGRQSWVGYGQARGGQGRRKRYRVSRTLTSGMMIKGRWTRRGRRRWGGGWIHIEWQSWGWGGTLAREEKKTRTDIYLYNNQQLLSSEIAAAWCVQRITITGSII